MSDVISFLTPINVYTHIQIFTSCFCINRSIIKILESLITMFKSEVFLSTCI